MSTSGTVGQTLIDAVKVIEHACRKCGVVASNLSGEQLLAAQENLFLRLVSLSNRGINLWCLQRWVLPMSVGAGQYSLPLNTVEILQPLFRQGTYTAATTLAGATASVVYASAVVVGTVLATLPAAGTYTLAVEGSNDNLNWASAGGLSVVGAGAGDQVGVEVTGGNAYLYWRLRETALSITWASVTFVDTVRDLPMSLLNQADYASLPSKAFMSNTVLQYYLDKRATAPVISVWPLPSIASHLVLWLQRSIQDVGDLTNTLDIPQRWLNAIIFELAKVMYLELPKEMVVPGRYADLQTEAERYTREAEDGERDGAPIRITPRIGMYTRG